MSTPVPQARRPPALPSPPTARAAALASMAQRRNNTTPGRLNGNGPRPLKLTLNEQERIHSSGRMRPPNQLHLHASQPEYRPFNAFSHLLDSSGQIRVGSIRIHSSGIVFGDVKYSMQREHFIIEEELGVGNYGSVRRVLHTPSGMVMAMKETRLNLEQDADERIVRELEILHKAQSDNIVKFHGAFTIESRVYSLMEFMDAGSLDKLTCFERSATYKTGADDELVWQGVPEPVLKRMCASIVRGLKALKDDLDVMHRDVKPTNVLMNLLGEVKLCDFGVSKQLEKSLAKTNIGCQSYMAPERIQGESRNAIGDYTVAADVWSLGLTIIEIATGRYPYPPQTYGNVFAQLQCILAGDLPTLPIGYSEAASDWVNKCLIRNPNLRPSYSQLLDHSFLANDANSDVDMKTWVEHANKFRGSKLVKVAPVKDVLFVEPA